MGVDFSTLGSGGGLPSSKKKFGTEMQNLTALFAVLRDDDLTETETPRVCNLDRNRYRSTGGTGVRRPNADRTTLYL